MSKPAARLGRSACTGQPWPQPLPLTESRLCFEEGPSMSPKSVPLYSAMDSKFVMVTFKSKSKGIHKAACREVQVSERSGGMYSFPEAATT